MVFYSELELLQATNSNEMVDFMINYNTPQQHISTGFYSSTFLDHQLNFSDLMQFSDFGPKLGLINQTENFENKTEVVDPVLFPLKISVMNDDEEEGERENEARDSENGLVQLGENNIQERKVSEGKKRKRSRSMKTNEEVESQRMIHIAVERNRRKQMNEHLRVLRCLMPSSYVQRGDQASIVGGAIEFVRELEQLLQCLESQKRRRLFGDTSPRPPPIGDSSLSIQQQPQPPFFLPMPPPLPKHDDQISNGVVVVHDEEIAESKSCLADVEVRILGFDALIKILCIRRRPGQLIRTIAALEHDLQLYILHTNITTIQQAVLYSFNVKVSGEQQLTAEDIANSVQQIFSFIQTDNSM